MTAEENNEEGRDRYEVRLLRELRESLRSIDGRVEDILDEMREHFRKNYDAGWDFYDAHEDSNGFY